MDCQFLDVDNLPCKDSSSFFLVACASASGFFVLVFKASPPVLVYRLPDSKQLCSSPLHTEVLYCPHLSLLVYLGEFGSASTHSNMYLVTTPASFRGPGNDGRDTPYGSVHLDLDLGTE